MPTRKTAVSSLEAAFEHSFFFPSGEGESKKVAEVRPRPVAEWLSDVSWARLSELEDLGKGPWPGSLASGKDSAHTKEPLLCMGHGIDRGGECKDRGKEQNEPFRHSRPLSWMLWVQVTFLRTGSAIASLDLAACISGLTDRFTKHLSEWKAVFDSDDPVKAG